MGIEPHLPTGLTGPARDDDRRTSAASFTCCNRVRDGAIVRVNAALTRPPTIASIVGPSADGGAQLEALAKLGKDSVSTSVKAHRCASGGKGGHNQAIGRSRGGRTTKIHALSDPLCRPVVLHLTPGQDADITAAPDVSRSPHPCARSSPTRAMMATAFTPKSLVEAPSP